MKKVLSGLFVGCIALTAACDDSVSVEADSDFAKLSEPSRYVSGAFCGISFGPSFVSHKLSAHSSAGDSSFRKSSVQWDVALLGGFGSSFYKDYYAGIELEVMERFGKKTRYEGNLGLRFSRHFGINMDVRFGRQFPEYGNLVFLTFGFCRTLGKVVAKTADGAEMEKGFGSYFPTVGFGVEHKINHDWNVRLDYRCSIASKDSGNTIHGDRAWNYDVKPQRMGVRLSITKSM